MTATSTGPAYRVLGEIAVDGDPVTRRRERELFALLVAARGRPLSAERVIDEVWTDGAGRPAVQVAVSRLRALLDPTRSGRPSCRPRRRATTSGQRPTPWTSGSSRTSLEQALAARSAVDRLVLGTRAAELWAGEPYAECQATSLRSEATRLAELHVTVQECRADALLTLGHPAAAVRLLARHAPDHPYREQLWALLARAQYACARQADALATLATLRARLAEDLGVDPSPLVRSTERAILTQDSALARTAHRGAERRPRSTGAALVAPLQCGFGHRRSSHLGLTGTMTR